MESDQKKKHLRLRAAFGLSLPDEKQGYNPEAWLHSSAHIQPLNVVEKGEIPQMQTNSPTDTIKQAISKSRGDILKLNGSWMDQLTDPRVVIREKMTLFWHDHFACRVRSGYLAQQQNNVLRQHALGKFGDLLHAVSKDPGMLQFLNNQQNKKNSPNENFARELLELFTLGRGHYTEDDIKNSARSFTGWAFNPVSGKFFFREKVHDDGLKTFRGRKGNFSGEDILEIILEDKQTARFVMGKLWQYFVSDDQPDDDLMASLSTDFFNSGYDIKKILFGIFTSSWFYDPRYTGNRIKSPVELVAGMLTQTNGKFEYPQASLFVQRALGQVLLLPPNVGGWPSGTAWIDSSSLTFRMSLASVMLKNGETTIDAKDDGDVNNETNRVKEKKITLRVNWGELAERFVRATADESLSAIEYYLLARPGLKASRQVVRNYAGGSTSDPEFVKKAFIGFMSLPEYQLS